MILSKVKKNIEEISKLPKGFYCQTRDLVISGELKRLLKWGAMSVFALIMHILLLCILICFLNIGLSGAVVSISVFMLFLAGICGVLFSISLIRYKT